MGERPTETAVSLLAGQVVKLSRDEVALRVPIHIEPRARELLLNETGLALAIERVVFAAGPGGQAAALPALAKAVANLGRADGSEPSDIFEAFSALLIDAIGARMKAEERAAQRKAAATPKIIEAKS